jgi:hypothetical protein
MHAEFAAQLLTQPDHSARIRETLIWLRWQIKLSTCGDLVGTT